MGDLRPGASHVDAHFARAARNGLVHLLVVGGPQEAGVREVSPVGYFLGEGEGVGKAVGDDGHGPARLERPAERREAGVAQEVPPPLVHGGPRALGGLGVVHEEAVDAAGLTVACVGVAVVAVCARGREGA